MSEKLTVSSSSGSGVSDGAGGGTTIDDIGQDLLHFVLTRLPMDSFAAAACVSHCWNEVCQRVFSVPKLSSAISLHPSLKDAVEEVVDKVLSEPIRQHFAIFGTTHTLSLDLAHNYITEKLSSRIPVVSYQNGEFKEMIYHDFQLES